MKWTWRDTANHQFFDLLRLVGLRDRLRCPTCRAVGTFKPHGGWLDRTIDWWTDFKDTLLPGVRYATERRWVCKYCGFVRDQDGEQQAFPNSRKKVWDVQCEDSAPTPKRRVEHLGDNVWPWRG